MDWNRYHKVVKQDLFVYNFNRNKKKGLASNIGTYIRLKIAYTCQNVEEIFDAQDTFHNTTTNLIESNESGNLSFPTTKIILWFEI